MSQPKENDQIKHAIDFDPIDRILALEEPILPSSGFLASVMERVQEESRTPAPIPFPWKRAIPGILLATGTFGWGAYEFMREAASAVRNLAAAPTQILNAHQVPLEQAAWVVLALAVSLLSVKLSRRLSGQS
jgi:hypothetical protein